MTLDIRTLTEDDVPDWLRAVGVGFLNGAEVSQQQVDVRRGSMDLDRVQGAYDNGRCIGSFRTTPQEMTVPGGATLPTCAVTNVTVSPTHRRRGLLTRMMGAALQAAEERGDAFATLVSVDYPIYGRYGFGPAAWTTAYEVDVTRTGMDRRYAGPPKGAGRVDLVDLDEFHEVAPEFHERYRRQPHRQGTIDRTDRWWGLATGRLRFDHDGWNRPFCAVHRDDDGVVQGTVTYTVEQGDWRNKLPESILRVSKLEAATPEAERALWGLVLSVDWVTTVHSGFRAPDDVLPLLLPNPRAARIVTQADFLWLRPLDVPRMLRARTYGTEGALVLELHDPSGPAGGRFRLEVGSSGTVCERTTDDPDLAMDVAELGTLYLGDESATRLAVLGRVDERKPGAAAVADGLFRTARRAWCPDIF